MATKTSSLSRRPHRYVPPINHADIERPRSVRHSEYDQVARISGPIMRESNAWQDWDEITIKFRGLRPGETTLSLSSSFERHGNVSYLEIFEDKNGQGRDGSGQVRFAPPPSEAFWRRAPLGTYMLQEAPHRPGYPIYLSLNGQRGGKNIQSPIKKYNWYPRTIQISASALHFGLMISPGSMMPLHKVVRQPDRDLKLVVDLLHRRLVAEFQVIFQDPRSEGDTDYVSGVQLDELDRINKYKFEIPFNALTTISRMKVQENIFALVIDLDTPPQCYRKKEDTTGTHSEESNIWTEHDTWFRQTDIVYDPYRLRKSKIALHKERPVIDIGRWTTYLFEFSAFDIPPGRFDLMKQALQDFNIEIVDIERLEKAEPHPAALWPLINSPTQTLSHFQKLASDEQVIQLPFEVRYQLEVCISREKINEYNITSSFIRKLAQIAAVDPVKARNILEYAAGQDDRIFDPMTVFEDPEALSFSAKTNIPHYCAYFRKATITPSTMYLSSPTVETTNRVLRHYKQEHLDGRFLRVQFTDELGEGKIFSAAEKQRNDELFTRVYRTLFNGIQIGDRHFEFLAFGNSQFRENGAYFFCPTPTLSCNDIRDWMGDFSHINVVAKYAARLGQCFSTTRAINGLSSPQIKKIPDIERTVGNVKYCFTDGVGKISYFLAQMIAAELGIRSNIPPSTFQFRLGGCKGMLAVWPGLGDREVHIRKSQQKFTAVYNGLEIIKCSHFSTASLNRQTITILSALGVPDQVFLRMLTDQLANYQIAMSNDDLATSLLLRYIDDNQMTINIATMIRNGFMAERDPFVLSLLHLWRSWSIKLLKEKAKIIVENGAFLLGCIDETETLRGYTKPKAAPGQRFTKDELPQIFLQVPDKEEPNRYNVIEGICLVGRNPSLHPGDLRVVEAVNVPALHHLRDVVVFPAKGERDIPSMCSGGDLDGDDYFVIWDKDLQPPEWNCEPMNYTPPKPKELNRKVEIVDLMKFFVRYMKNDSLPTIAHAHLAQSDFLKDGVKDPKCLELAALHSKAVDYVKSGEAAQMPKRLRPTKFPHFMEKIHKPKSQQYESEKILGLLYNKVESVDFVPQYKEPFDVRILRAYGLDDALLKTARQIKSKYDTAMRRLMAQQDIKTEFEIWSTFVLSKPRVGSDYKVQEEIARLSDGLKDQFRSVCIEKAGSKEFSVLGPFVAAMYKVTKEEMDIALAECRATKIVNGLEVPKRQMTPKYMPLMSFPWLFEKELGRIATGVDTSDELEDLGIADISISKLNPGRKRARAGVSEFEDYIQQENGVIVHRGEELDLFRHDSDSDGSEPELEDRENHRIMKGRDGEAVLATEFEFEDTVEDHLGGGTGVEDVVPQAAIEGFINRPVKAAPSTVGSASNASFNTAFSIIADPQTSASKEQPAVPNTLTQTQTESTTPTPSHTPASSSSEPALSPDLSGTNSASVSEQEDEMVSLEIEESPFDRLQALMISDPPVPPHSPAVEEEDEIVELEIEETPMDKLTRLMES